MIQFWHHLNRHVIISWKLNVYTAEEFNKSMPLPRRWLCARRLVKIRITRPAISFISEFRRFNLFYYTCAVLADTLHQPSPSTQLLDQVLSGTGPPVGRCKGCPCQLVLRPFGHVTNSLPQPGGFGEQGISHLLLRSLPVSVPIVRLPAAAAPQPGRCRGGPPRPRGP